MWKRRIGQHRDAGHPGGNLLEEFQAFAYEVGTDQGQPRDVPAGSRQAGDEARPHRIPGFRHDDGNGRGRLHGRPGRWHAGCRHDDVNRDPDQLNRERGQLVELALRITACQDEVLPLHIAQLAEPLEERRVQVRFVGPPAPV